MGFTLCALLLPYGVEFVFLIAYHREGNFFSLLCKSLERKLTGMYVVRRSTHAAIKMYVSMADWTPILQKKGHFKKGSSL